MVTRWISGSSPVRYLRNSVTLFSCAATLLCFNSSRLLARANSPVLLPLNLLRRLRRRHLFILIWCAIGLWWLSLEQCGQMAHMPLRAPLLFALLNLKQGLAERYQYFWK